MASGKAIAQNCGPSLLGNPCAQGDSASQGALAPETNLGVGNPVHLVTGNKYLYEQDLPPLAQSPWLTLARHYNSLDKRSGPLGRGWTLNYDARLYLMGGQAHVAQADGSRISFPAPAAQSHSSTARGRLSRHAQGWRWSWPNGQSLDFDLHGRLVGMYAPIPRPGRLHIQRHIAGPLHGLISALRDETGNEIRLHYRLTQQQAYLESLDTPMGQWRYHYEAIDSHPGLRLRAVENPDGSQRRYLYEAERQGGDPWRPTGIALQDHHDAPLRQLRRWHYDSQGRVIRAWQATSPIRKPSTTTPGFGAVSFTYSALPQVSRDGWTQLETHDGRRLRLHTRRRHDHYALPSAVLTLGHGTTASPEGWPGLRMRYDAAGRRSSWYSPLTGAQHLQYNALGQLSSFHTSGGEHWQYRYDSRGRLQSLSVSRGSLSQHIQLHWQHDRLVRIEHPAEHEALVHDPQGRVTERTLSRPALSGTGQRALHYRERFEYDGQGRLSVHHLPEGGALHYRWSARQGLASLEWRDRQGRHHPVLQSHTGHSAYRHGNGLRTRWRMLGEHGLAMVVLDEHTPLWAHVRHHDAHGRITHLADWQGWYRTGQGWRFSHDQASRMIQAAPWILPPLTPPTAPITGANMPTALPSPRAAKHTNWYAWHADGALAAQRQEGRTWLPEIKRDANGLPHRIEDKRLRYGLTGRLGQVRNAQEHSAHYTHNAHGYRISARYDQPLHTRLPDGALPKPHSVQYLYIGQRLVAEIDSRVAAPTRPGVSASETLTAAAITRRYLYGLQGLAAFIDYSSDTPDGALYIVHTDPLGTPKLVTDARRRMRWLAHYSPTGELLHAWGDMDLALRLPGQVADPFTGWHDNLLRTYAPAMGAYLEPDPLGPLPGQQALGYARQQAQRYADPTGLILFAFDGTRQGSLNRANVWKMSQLYQDGTAHYHAGPGNPYYIDLDSLSAHSGFDIVTTQWQRLLSELRSTAMGVTQAIDIIGYSRGAALARHFGNMIAEHTQNGWFRYVPPGQGLLQACVDLRFMGLFDTVAQLGPNGALNRAFDFSIHPAWTRVAHAVALHEYRSWFPLTSTSGSENVNTLEAPFVGSHADIGGGLGAFTGLYIPSPSGDLANVALNWMLEQGRLAGVSWSAGPAADQEVQSPILNDYRPAALRWLYDGDRRVDDAFNDTLAWRQATLDALGAPHRQTVDAFIRRFEDWRTRDDTAVGEVNMDDYAQWLQSTLGWSLP